MILNRAKDHYENDKKSLRMEATDKYRNLYEEKKKKREYEKNSCRNMSEENKRLKEYQKIIARQKNLNIIVNKIVF